MNSPLIKAPSLETLMEEWNRDCVVDETNLDSEALSQGKLHSKWLNYLSSYKMKALAIQKKQNETRVLLSRYYNGHMTKTELESIGRPQYLHKQPIKSELERMIAADPLFADTQQKYEINIILAEYCEEVIKAIKDRGFNIKNAADWRKFIAGA